MKKDVSDCNGYSDNRSVQENFDLITSSFQESADKHIPSKIFVPLDKPLGYEVRFVKKKKNKKKKKKKKKNTQKRKRLTVVNLSQNLKLWEGK